ncbi:MAG: rRNA maturation RNase YbeY [Vicinamibacteria bacterium]
MSRSKSRPPSLKAVTNEPTFSVLFANRQRKHSVRVDDIRRVLHGAASAMNSTGELSVVFAGDALLHQLNRDYRFKDKPTDVLSFESQGEDMGLGDIAISVETARVNALRFGRALDRELEILALHGFLHVLGYDHETDHGQMEALEKKLRAKLLTRPEPSRRAARVPTAKRVVSNSGSSSRRIAA